ncbi:MAG: HEAT repeat domain-containing protein [Proteobacteria bacterium]|nr:HEAT repeat domain-containing protein [Pseudomonadota bacterium]
MLGSLVPFLVFADEQGEALRVEFEASPVSVHASEVPVLDLLQAIAAESRLRIVQHTPLTGLTSLQVERVSLTSVLDKVLGGASYQLYQGVPDSPIPATLWIFSAGSKAASAADIFFEAVILYGSLAEKREAIRELARLSTPEAVEALSLATGDEDARVRGAAMAALSRIGTDAALAAVASAAADADPWVRGQAVGALAAGDSESALQYLNLAFTDLDPNVRLAVIEAFADNPGDQSIAILSMALRDDNPMVRMHAVDALEEIGGELAFATLMRARGGDDVEVAEAIEESISLLMQQP